MGHARLMRQIDEILWRANLRRTCANETEAACAKPLHIYLTHSCNYRRGTHYATTRQPRLPDHCKRSVVAVCWRCALIAQGLTASSVHASCSRSQGKRDPRRRPCRVRQLLSRPFRARLQLPPRSSRTRDGRVMHWRCAAWPLQLHRRPPQLSGSPLGGPRRGASRRCSQHIGRSPTSGPARCNLRSRRYCGSPAP